MAIEADLPDLPTSREVTELLPDNRRAYASVHHYFGLPVRERPEAAAIILHTLNEAQIEGNLEPPLTPEMAKAVHDFSEYARLGGDIAQLHMLTSYLIDAVFEHGYRRDDV